MESEQGRWRVDDYVTASGVRPIREFVQTLTERDRVEAVALIKLLGERGNALRRPQSAPLGDGLFELRGSQVRMFYVFRPGRRITVLDGVVKKQRRVPADALRRARRYQKEITAKDAIEARE